MVCRKILFICVLSFLASCGAVKKQIQHGKLETETRMSDTIFLDPITDNEKTVYLQIRNTTDKSGLEIKEKLASAIQEKGYKIVSDPSKAYIMIQANILQVGRTTDEDPFNSVGQGYGSAISGAVAGAAVGGLIGGNKGALGGAVVVGAASYLIDSAVQVITYSMITDLQISEKTKENVSEGMKSTLKQGSSNQASSWSQKTNWKKYQTRVVSVAKKVNLKFEDAEPSLTQGLVKSISGIL